MRYTAIIILILFFVVPSRAQKNMAALKGKTFRVYYWIDNQNTLKDSLSGKVENGPEAALTISFPLKKEKGCLVKYGIINHSTDSLTCLAFFEMKVMNDLVQFGVPGRVKETYFDPCRGHTDYSDLIYNTFSKDKSYTWKAEAEYLIVSDPKNNIWIKFKKMQDHEKF